MKFFCLVVAVLFSSVFESASARVWYVKHLSTSTLSGNSWTTAFVDLQSALTAASSGDTVYVAKGIYMPSLPASGSSTDSRDVTFKLKSGVLIFGGFAGSEIGLSARKSDSTSLHVTNASILSGDIGAIIDSTDNAYHVVFASGVSAFVLDGFTITGGNANGTSALNVAGRQIGRHYGGGVYNDSSSGTYSHIVLERNTAKSFDDTEGGGAGMYNFKGSPLVTQSVFYKNHAQDANGGGMKNNESKPTVSNCSFTQNSSFTTDEGGGAVNNIEHSDARFTNVVFDGNVTDASGGGVYNDSSFPIFSDCTFSNNYAASCGGGLDFDNGSNGTLNGILFLNNTADEDGGGVYGWKSDVTIYDAQFISNKANNNGGGGYFYNTCNPKMTNVHFSKNIAGNDYGGFGIERNSNAILTNALFSRNKATRNGGGIGCHDNNGTNATLLLTNATIVNNSALTGGGGYDQGSTSQLRNSIIFGNYPDNLDANPALILNVRSVIFDDGSGPAFYKDGSVSTTGVAVSAPFFRDTTNSNYQLASASAALDAGDSTFFSSSSIPNISFVKTDLRAADRIMGKNIDLGCYEYCTNSVTPTATIVVTPNDSVLVGTNVTFTLSITNGGANPKIQWMKNSAAIVGETGMIYTAMAGGRIFPYDTIWAKVQSSELCAIPDSVTSNRIRMYVWFKAVENTVLGEKGFMVIPNPSRGKFRVSGNFLSTHSYDLVVFDQFGRSIYREQFSTGNKQKEVVLPVQVSPGVYWLGIAERGQGQKFERLIIE
ncbi:MAG: hypothetical protein JST36_00485 [Bacteroidetes bacterium]|nr:hypothetical protein [Bacteroidota bacterium]